MEIRNYEQLLSHGNVAGRRVVLDIIEAGLRASDPYESVKRLVRIEDGKLRIGWDGTPEMSGKPPFELDLSEVGHIYVIGGGKAAQRQAEALEDILGDLITAGHVNAKKGDSVRLKRVGVTLAGHPIPDDDSVAGSRRIVEVARRARRGDVVFFSESGGGSALLTLPAPGLTLKDLQDVNRILYFERGATMWDTNAVRNLLTVLRSKEVRFTGEATFVQISTDERPPGLRVHAGRSNRRLTSAEAYQHAIDVLHAYNCWDEMPESVRQFLLAADPRYAPLQPEEVDGRPIYRYRVAGPEGMIAAAESRAHELGLNAQIVASSLSDVEAKSAGEVLAYMAQETEVYGRPQRAPCVYLCGGELVVTVGNGSGLGGRNQEFALATAPRLAGSKRIVAASVDSDGNDGPTDAAGAIVDGETMARAREAGLDVFAELRRHNTYHLFETLGDAIHTGVRGTNVQDLRVVYVSE